MPDSTTVVQRAPRPARSGSSMSSKQMAYAATAGRRIDFHFLGAQTIISGYLVGMDDYHWLVATIETDWDTEDLADAVATVMVHKGSADLIKISTEATLDSEKPAIQAAIGAIGGGFVSWCNRTYFDSSTDKENS